MYRLPLANLGFLAAALPLLTIHLCFFVSLSQHYFEPCVPYWSDCISISKAGRKGTAYYLFKLGMIPSTILLGYFWHRCIRRVYAERAPYHPILIALPWIASLALAIYTLALGHAGQTFELLRRFGVVLFMALTFIVQVEIANALRHSSATANQGRQLLYFAAFILALAIFSLFLDFAMGPNYDRIENAFEWWLIVLLITQLALIARTSSHL